MKITITERKSLGLPFNLADAQNYVDLNSTQSSVVDDLGEIFKTAQMTPYNEIGSSFVNALFDVLQQPAALSEHNRVLLCYSATIALEVCASYVRLHGSTEKKVGLLHPTFDTLAYMTKRHGLSVEPISEDQITQVGCNDLIDNIGALVLTLPNNPTGFNLSEEEFLALAKYCKLHDILLIIDCCYRYYADHQFDYYRILRELGNNYLLVEDTGKLFPALDIKLGVLSCNASIFSEVESIHSDFLLEVSKFSMAVITQFLARQTHHEKSEYLQIISQNRSLLVSTLSRYDVVPIGGNNINVQLLGLPPGVDSTELQADLYHEGLGIVDGKRLYWSKQPENRGRVRVALSRDPKYFQNAMKVFDKVLMGYAQDRTVLSK